MSGMLAMGRVMRPSYLWDFYLFSNCYTYGWGRPDYTGQCSTEVKRQNDELLWLWGPALPSAPLPTCRLVTSLSLISFPESEIPQVSFLLHPSGLHGRQSQSRPDGEKPCAGSVNSICHARTGSAALVFACGLSLSTRTVCSFCCKGSLSQINESRRCVLMTWWSSMGSWELLFSLLNSTQCTRKSISGGNGWISLGLIIIGNTWDNVCT